MFNFRVPIGDWSGDGHGKCEYVDMIAKCENIQQIREAYFAAKAKYPDLCPEGWACEYEDGTIPDDIRNAYKDLGVEFEFSQLLDHDGFVLIQNGPKRSGLQLYTTTVTLTPEQAMQNADRWWDAASKLPLHNTEPLETPDAP